LICLMATASPVPQLKALYTEPNAPFPKHSPRRCAICKPICLPYSWCAIRSPSVQDLAMLFPSPPTVPFSAFLVYSRSCRAHSQPLICHLHGGPKTRKGGRPWPVFETQEWLLEGRERRSKALADRGFHPTHKCSRSWTRPSFHVAVSRGIGL